MPSKPAKTTTTSRPAAPTYRDWDPPNPGTVVMHVNANGKRSFRRAV